jgi:hypothetical protein
LKHKGLFGIKINCRERCSYLVPLTPVSTNVDPYPVRSQPAVKALPPGKHVELEVSSPGETTDSATIETVRRMAGYIRKSKVDPACQAAAEYAWRHFAAGKTDPSSLAWAAFWYVKHCVTFRNDETTMFRIGAQHNFDLLIAPDVLVRMRDPAEDCDGFTMLEATLLSIMADWFLKPGQLAVYIATVAAGTDDPERWSHVFAIAVLNGSRVLPLDSSHGSGPGWMVPRDRIHRFQAWNLNGKPTDIAPAKFQGLHGYVRTSRTGMGAAAPWVAPAGWTPRVVPLRYGMGAVRYRRRRRGVGQDDTSSLPLFDTSYQIGPAVVDTSGSLGQPLQLGTPGTGTDSWATGTSSPFNWTSFLNNLTSTAGAVAKVAETPMTTYTLPNGTVVTTPLAASNSALSSLGLSSSLSSMLPILGIGLLALFAFGAIGKKG